MVEQFLDKLLSRLVSGYFIRLYQVIKASVRFHKDDINCTICIFPIITTIYNGNNVMKQKPHYIISQRRIHWNHYFLSATGYIFSVNKGESRIYRYSSRYKFSICLYLDYCKTMKSNINEIVFFHQPTKVNTNEN